MAVTGSTPVHRFKLQLLRVGGDRMQVGSVKCRLAIPVVASLHCIVNFKIVVKAIHLTKE